MEAPKEADPRRLLWTVFFVGYIPKLPGTIAALVALGIFLLLAEFTASPIPFWAIFLLTTGASLLLAPAAQRALGTSDPPSFVIDEAAGMFAALLFISSPANIWEGLTAFAFFRLFDIAKPPPIRQLDRLHHALGITLDDLAAACYAQACWRLVFFLLGRLW